jgi:Tol biopolymer transport system component
LGNPEVFLGTPAREFVPAFSPDGHWLAYAAYETGIPEIFVRPFPGPGGQRRITSDGGLFPVWSQKGHELLYETLERRIMAVSYTMNGGAFIPGKLRVWTDTELINTGPLPEYDLAPDGKRIAALLGGENAAAKPVTHVIFLLNFFDEVKRKVAEAK